MKEIGIKLKEKREENGVSVEEVAEDLKLRPNQIISLEEGIKEDFDDVFYLKELIKDYAKYLGLDGEQLVDDFNEYLFDYTSKIPLDYISPYTVKKNNSGLILKILVIVIIVVTLVLSGYFIFGDINQNKFSNNDITYVIRR